MYIPVHEFIKYALWPPFRELFHLPQPRGIVSIMAFARASLTDLAPQSIGRPCYLLRIGKSETGEAARLAPCS
jgi:hypothetical protein